MFGESGTVGQHSFHQLLHQGSDKIAADFIGVSEDDLGKPLHHAAMLSNMAGQAAAFAFGQKAASSPQENYAGGRSSNLILLDKLDPYRFGLLIALYEHKTFVQGIIWNVNSFDQPGVELGKKMAKALESGVQADTAEARFTELVFKKLGHTA